MSALCGFFYKNGTSAGTHIIQAMTASMNHLGLDHSAIWCQENIALGQQISHTTTESLSTQLPFFDNINQIALAAVLRLDNRLKLCDKLNLPLSTNDSQLILQAYKYYGCKLAIHLFGDFTIVIWNQKQQTLICCSDIMNCRPIYYYNSNTLFAFASEIRALHIIPEIKREFNLKKIAKLIDFATINATDDTNTYFSNIHYLQGNKCLKITKSTTELNSYWQPDLNYKLDLKNENEYVATFQEIFTQAINDRANSTHPLGLMLSGGLDSGAIAAISTKTLSIKLNAFFNALALNHTESNQDERKYVELLTHSNLNINYLTNSSSGPFDNLSDLLWKMESPNYIFQQYIHRDLAKMMHQQNIRVVLDGMYGEMGPSFDGKGYFNELLFQGKLISWYQELTKVAAIEQKNYLKLLLHSLGLAFIPNNIKNFLNHTTSQERIKYAGLPLQPDFITQYLNTKPEKIMPNAHFSPQQNQYNAILVKQNMHPIYSYIEKTGIELVHPYLDRRILEFCLSVPNSMHIKHGYKRYLIRRSMQKIMPIEICNRITKSAFIPNYLTHYTQNISQLYNTLEEISANSLVNEIINIKKFRQMIPKSNFTGSLMNGQNMLACFVIPMTLGLGIFLTI